VAETLRLASNEVESDITRYRLWIMSALVVATAMVGFVNPLDLPAAKTAVAFELLYLGVGVGVWALVKWRGVRQWVSVSTLVLDLAAPSLFYAWLQHFAPSFPSWVNYVVPTLLTAGLLINMLRYQAMTALVGAGVAVVVFLVMRWQAQGDSSYFVTLVIIGVTALIGVASTRRAHRNLETLARLQLLRRFLPPAAVERVMKSSPDAALSVGGEAVTVTMMVSDLRGFTALSQHLPPGEVVRFLNRFHGTMLEQVHRHGGVLDKFIGDGALVVFGLARAEGHPSADQGAQAAVACARDMVAALHQLDAVLGTQEPLRMGIGIHTGPVIAGNIGAPGRRVEFTVIGDAVNTASRIEGLTKELGHAILVSHETTQRLVGREGLTPLPPVTVRGKDAPLTLYSLAVPESLRVPLPVFTPPETRATPSSGR